MTRGSPAIAQSQPERNWYMYQPGFTAGAAMSMATLLVPAWGLLAEV
jgi:hypothetical protein